ncbi:DUF397 domain-containing protein [Streptomyces paludis]|uniref:DUF397 domain-containing protein n=1 Tax=Streptomyces paludis TaxID=2282738 RepID=UPI00269117F4
MTAEVVGPYRKSSYSGHNNDCVEVAPTANGCAIRDSKDHARQPLGFARAQWQIFLTHTKADTS